MSNVNARNIKIFQEDNGYFTVTYVDESTQVEYKVTYNHIYSPSRAKSEFIKYLKQL